MANFYSIQYRKMDENLTVEENFLKALEAERNYDGRNPLYGKINIYYHLFFMLHHYHNDFLHWVVDQYKTNSHYWFYSLHKQFRQEDMYEGMGYYDRRISEKDNERRSELLRLRQKRINEARPSHKDFEEEEVWNDELKKFYDNDEVLEEIRAEVRPLNTWYNSFEMKESFSGNMAMVMWLTISNDSEETLYRFMDEFMAMHFGIMGYEEKRLFPEEGEQNG